MTEISVINLNIFIDTAKFARYCMDGVIRMEYEHYRDSEEYFRLGKNTSNIHFHRSIELLYCMEHAKTVYLDGEERTVQKGELLVVPRFLVHYVPRPEYYQSLSVVMPVQYTDIFQQQAGGRWFHDFVFSDKQLTEDICQHLLRLQHAVNPLLRRGIYHYVLGVLLENGTLIRQEQKQSNDFAQRTLTYLENHYAEKLSLETVADALGYNRCYFSTLFKKTFHAGFCDYLSMLRINKSLTLLQNQSISDAAFAVGFGSVQNYYTNFKRIYGMPPAAYLGRK